MKIASEEDLAGASPAFLLSDILLVPWSLTGKTRVSAKAETELLKYCIDDKSVKQKKLNEVKEDGEFRQVKRLRRRNINEVVL